MSTKGAIFGKSSIFGMQRQSGVHRILDFGEVQANDQTCLECTKTGTQEEDASAAESASPVDHAQESVDECKVRWRDVSLLGLISLAALIPFPSPVSTFALLLL